jgi:RimJ/RimL family protein N-acetyltransferase
MITQSKNLSLSLYLSDHQHDVRVQAFWEQLRESTVEAIEAPVPCFSIFAEECLLCAVVKKTSSNIEPSEEQIMSRNIVNELGDFIDPPEDGSHTNDPIGLVYVTAAPAQSVAGEANVGIVIADSQRGNGFAREAVDLVLRWAFEELKFHRIQAAIMDSPQKDRSMRLFIAQGFTHEGTRRRSVFKRENAGMAGVWKDVTYFAMLDTEWALRDSFRNRGSAPTLWDEMFARHAREREEMVKWDERHNRPRRVSSTDTLRNGDAPQPPSNIIDAWPSDLESSSSSSCGSSHYGSVPPSPPAGAADISEDMLEYLAFEESRRSPMEDTDAASRQSSPSPYSFSFPSSPIPIPPRSPSVHSSISGTDSEDEAGVGAPLWRGLHGIPSTSASARSSGVLGWRPLIPVRSGSVSSESESWSDAQDASGSGSDWDMMSEPERVAS